MKLNSNLRKFKMQLFSRKRRAPFCLIVVFLCFTTILSGQYNTISETYTLGNIPTSYLEYNPTCTENLTINWPVDGLYFVDSVEIEYDMIAGSTGWIADQRSQIYCSNRQTQTGVYSGIGNMGGAYSYFHEGLDFANGAYDFSFPLDFEMRAWREFGVAPTCGTNFNRVDDGTWSVKVYYYQCPPSDTVITSQVELDAFILAYSECLDRGFPLTIEGCNDLSGLSFIDTIIGLTIRNNPDLVSLSGLENLTLATDLIIENNANLQNLDPLSNLTTVGNLLRIENNSQLTDLEGLTNVSGGVNILSIINNNSITDLQGLSNLNTIFSSASIYSNDMLTSTIGFSPNTINSLFISSNLNLVSLAPFNFNSIRELYITANPLLTSLSSLANLNNVIETIEISSCPITNLEGLEGLKQALYINISSNELLTDISQLVINIKEIEGSLNINGNLLLEECCLLNELRPRLSGSINLFNNAESCSNWSNLYEFCEMEDPDNDGISDATDNCDEQANPLQEDLDGDGIGNACDNCPLIANENQEDANSNFIGDACEIVEPGKIGVNTTNPKSGLEISASELYLSDTQRGLIMTNATGECFRLYMDLEGKLQTTLITCPN